MSVERPEYLLALLVLLPILAIQFRAYVKGRRDILRLGHQWPEESVRNVYLVKWFFSSLAFDLFVAFALLAIADFTWGQTPVEEDRSGLDIAVVLDVSRSMLGDDVAPSRLARSAGTVRALGGQLPASRVALVAFKGRAVTLMPMTEDFTAVDTILESAGPSLISSPGTNLEEGLREALRRFPSGTPASRAIVVFSDGETLSGSIAEPLNAAREAGIPVYAVVVGTAGGATVPGPDGAPLLDEDQRPIVSRVDPEVMTRAATLTGGQVYYLDGSDGVFDLASDLSRFAEVRQAEGFRLVARRRYRLFLAVALVALVVSVSVRLVRWRDMF